MGDMKFLTIEVARHWRLVAPSLHSQVSACWARAQTRARRRVKILTTLLSMLVTLIRHLLRCIEDIFAKEEIWIKSNPHEPSCFRTSRESFVVLDLRLSGLQQGITITVSEREPPMSVFR